MFFELIILVVQFSRRKKMFFHIFANKLSYFDLFHVNIDYKINPKTSNIIFRNEKVCLG